MQARAAFLPMLGVYAATWLWVRPRLPARVPTHFGAGGSADAWSSRSSALVVTALLGLGCAAVFLGLVVLVRRSPRSLVNVPNAGYWTRPEHQPRMRELVTDDLLLFGSWTLLLLTAVQAMILHAARSAQPNVLPWAPLAVGAYVLGVAARTGWMYARRYAVPAGTGA